MALEDSDFRLQKRLNCVLNYEKAPNNFYMTTFSNGLSDGLLEQLENHLIDYPSVKLIVIDTLQKVRGNMKLTESAYSYDYKEVGALKRFADEHGICILLIHHLRKMKDNDVFNQISGTNGIAGAADTMMVLSKKNRNSTETTLSITGRDIDSSDSIIIFDKNTFRWKMLHTQEELKHLEELNAYNNDPVVITIKALLNENPKGIQLTASDLLIQIQKVTGVIPKQATPAALSRYIKSLKFQLQKNDNIFFSPANSNGGAGGRKLYFSMPSREL